MFAILHYFCFLFRYTDKHLRTPTLGNEFNSFGFFNFECLKILALFTVVNCNYYTKYNSSYIVMNKSGILMS